MHSATQGTPFTLVTSLPFAFEHNGNTTAVGYALHGLRAIGLFFWAIPFLAWLHARREGGSAAAAFPFRLLDIDPSSKPGITVQAIAFLLLLMVPFVSAWHFWGILAERGRVCQSDLAMPCRDIWYRPADSSGLWDHTYRLTDGTSNNGPSYEPSIEPMLTLVMLGIAVVFTLFLLVEMYRSRARSRDGKLAEV
ncbi:hypothetical protein [Sinorhizobium meliloti]|uniref:Transmembrane protein n=1 Tax=Rhizobium meliloti TaxID=382 RepID=A0AAW9TN11_RHIML|nr:hypothetical protein [Sinorhizobium meliloti]MQW33445.1 hypothetical protein [Sinorhizobium meliloti]